MELLQVHLKEVKMKNNNKKCPTIKTPEKFTGANLDLLNMKPVKGGSIRSEIGVSGFESFNVPYNAKGENPLKGAEGVSQMKQRPSTNRIDVSRYTVYSKTLVGNPIKSMYAKVKR